MLGLGPIWTQALIGLLVGMVFGITLFPWLASPFSPGLWKLATPFTRVVMTLAQFIRGNGVLTLTQDGAYEIGTYVENDGSAEIQLADRSFPADPEHITWGLFGKKQFGLTWEPGAPLHERISASKPQGETVADGGETRLPINMAALHRYLRGANESDAIDRTEEHAKAEYGGGDTGFSDKLMAGLVILMLMLGALTSYLAF